MVKSVVLISDSLLASTETQTLFKCTRKIPSATETAQSLLMDVFNKTYTDAMNEKNADKLAALSNSIGAAANAPIYCEPNPGQTCSDVNRNPCTLYDNTCGTCLAGFTSPFSDQSNDPCVSVSARRRLATANGDTCSQNSDCDSQYCNPQTTVCGIAPKPCPQNFGLSCSGNGTCVHIDHKAQEIIDKCLVSDQDCFAYCKCNDGFGGKACQLTGNGLRDSDQLRYDLCNSIIEQNKLTTPSADALKNLITSVATQFTPFQVQTKGFMKCKEAVDEVFTLIEGGYLTSDQPDTVRHGSAQLISLLMEGFINMTMYNNTNINSRNIMSMNNSDSQDLLKKSQTLYFNMQKSMSPGDSSLEALSEHVRISSNYPIATSLQGATILPPRTSEQIQYNHSSTTIKLPDEGLKRCSNDNFVQFGMIEWGIMPILYQGNSSGWDRIETEMVNMIMPKTTKVENVDYDYFAYSRYNVTVHFQEAMEFNISSFNRTFPSISTYVNNLDTADITDGKFKFKDCNFTDYSAWNATFDCRDIGHLCNNDYDNSGIPITFEGNSYTMNTLAGGSFFFTWNNYCISYRTTFKSTFRTTYFTTIQ